MRHHRRSDDHRLERVVREHLVELCGQASIRIARREARALLFREVAEPGELGELVEVPREVRAPVAEAREADFRHGRSVTSTSAIRSEAWPSPQSCGSSAGICGSAAAAAIRPGSSSTITLAPSSTVSTHSVAGRTVTQGSPYQY